MRQRTAPSEPHAVELTVWDVPPTNVAGERFKFAVGARCSGGCDLGGRALSLFDHEGALAGTVKLGHDVWPGTGGALFCGGRSQSAARGRKPSMGGEDGRLGCGAAACTRLVSRDHSRRRRSRLRSHGQGRRQGEADADQGRARGHAPVPGGDRRQRGCESEGGQGPIRHPGVGIAVHGGLRQRRRNRRHDHQRGARPRSTMGSGRGSL